MKSKGVPGYFLRSTQHIFLLHHRGVNAVFGIQEERVEVVTSPSATLVKSIPVFGDSGAE